MLLTYDLHCALQIVGFALVATTLPLVVELLMLTCASWFYTDPKGESRKQSSRSFRLAVVIPAHNEESRVGRCVGSLRASEGTAASIFVIAHNCTDSTAIEAERAGARVVILDDPNQIGKGYALRHGLSVASEELYDAVLVIDADSVVTPNLLKTVVLRFCSGARVLQCRYGALNPEANERTRLMSLALLAFNVVRPRGRARLGLSAGIFGNGFGISRDVITKCPFGANSVVEDLEYHLALVRSGEKVEFIDSASVFGEMPAADQGAATQRGRWEGGRLRMAREALPQLLRDVMCGRTRFVEPLLDLAALPLAFEVVALAVALLVPIAWLREYAIAAIGVIGIHILTALRYAPASSDGIALMIAIPRFIAWKIAMVPGIWRASRPNAAWERTQRDSSV